MPRLENSWSRLRLALNILPFELNNQASLNKKIMYFIKFFVLADDDVNYGFAVNANLLFFPKK